MDVILIMYVHSNLSLCEQRLNTLIYNTAASYMEHPSGIGDSVDCPLSDQWPHVA